MWTYWMWSKSRPGNGARTLEIKLKQNNKTKLCPSLNPALPLTRQLKHGHIDKGGYPVRNLVGGLRGSASMSEGPFQNIPLYLY